MFQITVPVTKTFVEYIKHQPMIFEVYGHYQPPALHRVAIHDASNQQLQQVLFTFPIFPQYFPHLSLIEKRT